MFLSEKGLYTRVYEVKEIERRRYRAPEFVHKKTKYVKIVLAVFSGVIQQVPRKFQ